MTNPFDQFDEGNPFDNFDSPPVEPGPEAQALESANQPQGAGGGMHHGQKTIPEALARQAGLAARYIFEGAPAPIYMAGDAANALTNKVFGTHLQPLSGWVSDRLTDIGLPKPEGSYERVVGDMSRSVAGMGGFNALGQSMAKNATSPTTKAFANLLTEKPVMQGMAAIGAGAGAGGAREAGLGPGWQMATGLMGALVPGALGTGLEAGAIGMRGIKAAVKPMTEGGRQEIIGDTLRRFASNPDEAMKNLSAAQEIVPGSVPTAGEASGDYGLIAAQKAFENAGGEVPNAPRFSQRTSDQNAARQKLMSDMAGNEKTIESAAASRNKKTGALRDAAFSNKQPVDISALQKRILDMKAAPSGEREAVSKALDWVLSRLKGAGVNKVEDVASTQVDDFGAPLQITNQVKSRVADPERLYALRQDINDAMQGKFNQDMPALRLAKSELKEIKNLLDETIEPGAPGFSEYVKQYHEMSKPINQMELLQKGQQAAELPSASDPRSGYQFFSLPKMRNFVESNKDEISKTLTPEQQKNLNSILEDLDRSGALTNAAVRAKGSDTARNLSTNYMLEQMLGKTAVSPLGENMLRPLNWAMKPFDNRINDMIVNAMLDPKEAARLMSIRGKTAVKPSLNGLRQNTLANLLGLSVAEQQTQ